ncbi:MAG: radical SAM protein [Nitrospirae bacterium]|nr:radical SAM protein [Magnetococcales bacterium]
MIHPLPQEISPFACGRLFPVPEGQRPRLLILVPRAKFSVFNPMLALGPLMVAAAIKDFCDVRVIENNSTLTVYSDDQLLDIVRDYRPDLLGFNVVAPNAWWAYQLMAKARHAFPELVQIAGGLHAYHAAEEILALGQPDLVICGEGEIPIRKIMAMLAQLLPVPVRMNDALRRDLISIPGLMFRDAHGQSVTTGPVEWVTNLDDLPFIDFSLTNIEDFLPLGKPDRQGVTSLVPTQRGCPYRCVFCKADFMAGKIRNNSADYVIANVARLQREFNIDTVTFADNNFTIPRQRAMAICRLLVASGLSKTLTFRAWTNVLAPVDHEVCEAMVNANFISLQFGLERLSEQGMNAVNKRISLDVAVEKLRIIKASGLKVFSNILLGFPFETTETIRTELATFERYAAFIDGYQVWVVSPVPGTALYEQNPHAQQWYLRPEFTRHRHAYFSLVFIDPVEAILLNLFQLDEKTISAIVQAKKKYFLDFNFQRIKNPVLSLLFRLDIAMAYLSRWLYPRSMVLEEVLFWVPKILRSHLFSLVVRRYYKSLESHRPVENE